ncbi:PHP domain-containing protein [Microbulbifer sp. CAU 1566]|uniref:PHP domain-containing protein n=1 Tax=Microbulbifer sp. CAU 1566 TaxID=2933269 RepID=UPI00200562DE|nr:PHP domain-containing protein [Microbulbifer sp. CAU 1566]MCK7595705.1 PHP domain-containing protein [Microbulbifer sp. CAU 1566]
MARETHQTNPAPGQDSSGAISLTANALSGQVDLHCHSTASDGILSPSELVSRANSAGVTLLALTDHDTLDGLAEAQEAASQSGVTLLPGIELTALWGRRVVHIVGLNVDCAASELQGAIAERTRLREQRAQQIAERLEKRGFSGAYEGARALAGEGIIARPHFARWMVASGHVSDTSKAFKRYLGAGKIGDVTVQWPSIKDTIDCIASAGGAAVLAHPLKYGLTRSRIQALLTDFCAAGGRAVEVVCGQQNPVQTREILSLMERVNSQPAEGSAGQQCSTGPSLLASLGSDFHQPDQPWRALGSVRLPAGVEPVWNLWQTGGLKCR